MKLISNNSLNNMISRKQFISDLEAYSEAGSNLHGGESNVTNIAALVCLKHSTAVHLFHGGVSKFFYLTICDHYTA